MTKKLMPYKRSKNNLWKNTWISKKMLLAHLDLHNDAASRNVQVINKTIEWIEKQLNSNAAVLDLGCGPGLYAEALSKKGYKVTGLDISKRSIKYAKASAKKQNLNIQYFIADYLKKEIKGTHDCALCIYCDFGALTPSEQVILLQKIHTSLKKGVIVIFDVYSEELAKSRKEEKKWTYYKGSSFWNKKPCFVLEETVHFPRDTVWGTRSIVIQKKVKEYITWDTYYTKGQITELLRNNGFAVEEIREDLVEKNDFTSNAVLFIKALKI